MAKSFKGGLDSLIGGAAPKKKAKKVVKQGPSKDPVRNQFEQDSRGDIAAARSLGITLAEYDALQEKSLDQYLKAHPNRKKPGRIKTSTKVPKDTTEEGTLPGEKRATFIVKEEQLEKLKAVAYWERVKIKDVLTSALEKYLEAYEKKNGPVKKVKQ